MVNWAVMLKLSEGVQCITIDADLVDYSDDECYIEFSNVQSLDEAISLLQKLPLDMSAEEHKKVLLEFMKAIGKIRIASFLKSLVLGYYQTDMGSENGQ